MLARVPAALSSLSAILVLCAVTTAASPAQASSQSAPECAVRPLAPRPGPTGSDPVEIPANAAALAFGVAPVEALTSIGVKSTAGAAVAAARESWPDALVLRLGAPLVAGTTYVVEHSLTCAGGGAAVPETVRFRAGPVAPLPKSFGRLTQTTVTLPATSQPSWHPSLDLEPTEEATAWMPLTRFRVQVPGSAERVLETPYGGAGSGVPVSMVRLVNLGAFCATPRVTTLEVSATIAGEAAPYATAQVAVDTSAYCDEQDRRAEEADRQRAAQPAIATADDAGGCAVASAPRGSSSASGLAAVALALAAPFLRRRRAA
ncbi:MAG: hypothetical protein JST00_05680 [Deltaproteobacteria bacterium]|nr:hypothetical protein [Deltaproteobacteria bacterium]